MKENRIIDYSTRQNDILRIISQLDISPSMYKNAESKYKSLTEYLNNSGIDADMYPQGSFALGTVVRPNSKEIDSIYDLDFVCHVNGAHTDFTAKSLRESVENVLSDSDLYGGKLTVCDRCFTVQYADISKIGFSIDIVPAIDESEINKTRMRTKSMMPNLIDFAIAIPEKNDTMYKWITSNPRGYRLWFDNINKPFRMAIQDQYRKTLFEDNRSLFASVEDIPDALERSSLQRVIQILKYHRNNYFSKINNGNELKPISAIINTIVAQIASGVHYSVSVFELLQIVLAEFSIYSERRTLTEAQFMNQYKNREVINRKNGEWIILNPANPEDNLADQWNHNDDIPRYFFLWASIVADDLIASMQLNDGDFRIRIENAFGQKTVEGVLGNNYQHTASPKPISSYTAAKPWSLT